MSSYMSNQIIVGNLGRNPEMRYTPEGQPVTDFSVAVNRQYTNKAGETIKDVVWFRVSSWGKQAEVVNQYLKKGSKVLVEGRLVYDPATGGPRPDGRRDRRRSPRHSRHAAREPEHCRP